MFLRDERCINGIFVPFLSLREGAYLHLSSEAGINEPFAVEAKINSSVSEHTKR